MRTTSPGSRGSSGRANRNTSFSDRRSQRPPATLASHRVVRNRRRDDVRRRAGLLRAPAEQVLEDPARDRADAGAVATASVPRPAAASDRSHGFGEDALGNGSPDPAIGTEAGCAIPLERFDRGIPAEFPCVHEQGGGARIPRRQARLRRAGGADRRYPDLDPALHVGRGEWKLAAGSVACVCGP